MVLEGTVDATVEPIRRHTMRARQSFRIQPVALDSLQARAGPLRHYTPSPPGHTSNSPTAVASSRRSPSPQPLEEPLPAEAIRSSDGVLSDTSSLSPLPSDVEDEEQAQEDRAPGNPVVRVLSSIARALSSVDVRCCHVRPRLHLGPYSRVLTGVRLPPTQ